MAFDKIVGVDGTTYQFPSVVRQRIADNIETVGSVENLAVIDALGPALALKSNTTHNHTLASLTSNGIDELGDVEIGVVGPNGIALADKHTLQYEASTSRWRNKVASGGVTVSETPPATPILGDAWFDSNDGTLYVYYSDGTSVQWVQVQANSALEGTILERLGAVESRATALEAVPDYSPNYIINGAFDIWQRGTSFTNPASAHTADRWVCNGTGYNVAQITSSLPTGFASGLQTTVTTNGTAHAISQQIEYRNIYPLLGKSEIFSFWARANANNTFSRTVTVAVRSSTTEDQRVWHGNNSATTTLIPITITTSWARYTVDLSSAIPSNARAVALEFNMINSGSVIGDGVSITGVQLEEGSVATPFRRNANSIQGELAACQRYYEAGNHPWHMLSWSNNSFVPYTHRNTSFKVVKRVTPAVSVTVTSGDNVPAGNGTIPYITQDAFIHQMTVNSASFPYNAVQYSWTASSEL